MAWLGLNRWIKWLLIGIIMLNITFTGQLAMAASGQDESINVIQQEDSKAKKDDNIVKFILFVTIDGLGEESVAKGYTPNLNGIAGSGVKTKAISVLPANTASAIASIMTGALPSEHKFTKPGLTSKVKALPEMIAEQKQSAVIIDGKNGVTRGLSPTVRMLTTNKGDMATTDIAIKEFENKKPYFMHVIFSGVDQANKKFGPQSPQHLAAVEEADKQVGRMLGKLHEYGLYQYSLVVVSGSYGVTDPSPYKRYLSAKEVLVPLYIKGPTIEAGDTIPIAIITNIAPTVSYILGMKTANQNSPVLWDILKNEGGSSEAYLLKKRVNDLAESLISTSEREFSLENEKIIVKDEKNYLENQKGKVQDIIEAKDREIKSRENKLILIKVASFIIFTIVIIGYLFEYRILKRRFLMFK